jgi:hypothetical protein
MRVIVTGGTGLIGRHLAASLIADGHEAIILSRNPAYAKDIPAGARLEAWDARTAEGWGSLADGAGAIVNLAGEPLGGSGFLPSRWTANRKQQILDSRRHAAQACIDAVRAASRKPEVFIQASAVGYYGIHGDEIITEESPHGSDFAAQTCVEWEAASVEVEGMGVRRVVIRTGLVLDRHEGVFTRLALPFRLFAGGTFGSGRQWMSWIHIDDQIAAIRFLLQEKSAQGVYDLTAPNPVTNKEFAQTMGKVMRRPVILPAPAFAFRLAFGEVATLVVDGQRVIPDRLPKHGFKFRYETLEPALRSIL